MKLAIFNPWVTEGDKFIDISSGFSQWIFDKFFGIKDTEIVYANMVEKLNDFDVIFSNISNPLVVPKLLRAVDEFKDGGHQIILAGQGTLRPDYLYCITPHIFPRIENATKSGCLGISVKSHFTHPLEYVDEMPFYSYENENLSLILSLGCKKNCTFCQLKAYNKYYYEIPSKRIVNLIGNGDWRKVLMYAASPTQHSFFDTILNRCTEMTGTNFYIGSMRIDEISKRIVKGLESKNVFHTSAFFFKKKIKVRPESNIWDRVFL